MNRLKTSTRLQLLAAAGFLAVVTLLLSATIAVPNGVFEEDAQIRGATLDAGCHATHSPTSAVMPILEGVPSTYVPAPGMDYEQQDYTLNISVVGGHDTPRAGFNLWVSEGSLSLHPDEDEGRVRFSDDGSEATHTAAGDTGRNWTVTWTSPAAPGTAVIFRLMTQVIDPDTAPPSQTDQWNQVTFVSGGEDGVRVVGEPLDIVRVEEFGVSWFAYWVGIVSFVFLGVVLLVYYVVFRYGETSKATDHRSRKKK